MQSGVCFLLQPPCCSPREEGLNCKCTRLRRQNMVCLHFTSSPHLLQPPVLINFWLFFQLCNDPSPISILDSRVYVYHYIVRNKAKGRISKWVLKENKAAQIFRKMSISYPLIRKYQGVRITRFSENFACFVFLQHPF